MTTTGDGGGWNRRRAGCTRKDTVVPDHAGIGMSTANLKSMRSGDRSIGVMCSYRGDRRISLAAALSTDGAVTQEVLRVLRCRSRDVA